ncbi:MAG: hypothetical protein WC007_05600 [Pelobacteraceae bacterium]
MAPEATSNRCILSPSLSEQCHNRYGMIRMDIHFFDRTGWSSSGSAIRP